MVTSTRVAQKRVSTLASLPTPTKGINDLDSLAAMPEGYAIFMQDCVANNRGISLRGGYKEWVTGIGSKVRTLIPYNAIDGAQKFFAATDYGIFDCTSSTDAPVQVATLSSGDVQYAQITNTAGAFLIVSNGVDPFLVYNGTTWITAVSNPTPSSPGQVKGADPSKLFGVHLYKNRLWFLERDSMTAYYLETDAVSGVLTPFYLGGIFSRGGYVSDVGDWSLNSGAGSGSGVSAFLVFRSNVGEVAIYSGADPNDAANWHMDALLFIAPPVGKKSDCEFGGDQLLLTKSGIIPLAKVLQGAATASLYEDALTKNISRTLAQLMKVYAADDWELWNLPTMQVIAVSIPAASGGDARQYIMNAQTGAWAQASLPATCFGVFGGEVYFGTSTGRVMHFSQLYGKNNISRDGTGGTALVGEYLTAFSYYGDPTTLKSFKLVRPTLQAAKEPSVSASIAVDFQLGDMTTFNTPQLSQAELAKWDDALWDEGVWSSSNRIFRPWSSVIGVGFSGAVRLRVVNNVPTDIIAYELVFEGGGVL